MPKVTRTQARRVAVNVNLTVGLLDRIDRLAESTGQTGFALIRRAVERLLEDAEDIAVSEAGPHDPNDKLVPWERVRAGSGL